MTKTSTAWRAPGRGYREILQTGVECLGQVDLVQLAEVILLAARSLETISPRFVLDLSHLGFLSEILTPLALPAEQKAAVLACLRQKNWDAMAALLSDCPADLAEPLLTLTTLSGPLEEVLPVLAPMAATEAAQAALAELKSIAALLTPFRRQIRLDFSLVNDMSYYNGLVNRYTYSTWRVFPPASSPAGSTTSFWSAWEKPPGVWASRSIWTSWSGWTGLRRKPRPIPCCSMGPARTRRRSLPRRISSGPRASGSSSGRRPPRPGAWAGLSGSQAGR